MGWRGFSRQVIAAARRAERQAQAAQRRSEREAQRRHKEMVRAQKDWERMAVLERARAEHNLFLSSVDVLLSMHKECSAPIDWVAVARTPAPTPPVHSNANEASASARLASYRPSFFARLFALEAKQRTKMQAAVSDAIALDRDTYARAAEKHQSAHEAWAWHNQVSNGVLGGDLAAYEAAVSYFEPLEELEEQGCQIQIGADEPWYVEVNLAPRDESIVPTEEKSLLASGKLSTKRMAAGKQRELYQDYLCGCALRCGRELLALLPIEFVVVHTAVNLLDKATGHHGPTTVLSVALSRSGIERLNFDAIDPSDAMGNFVHRMGFKKSTGFARVEPLASNELARSGPRTTNIAGARKRDEALRS
jgi:hypothetical protein